MTDELDGSERKGQSLINQIIRSSKESLPDREIYSIIWNMDNDEFERIFQNYTGKFICVKCPCAGHCASQLQWGEYDCPCICHINQGEDDYDRR